MNRSLAIGLLVMAILAASLVAPLGTAEANEGEQTIDELVTEASQQYKTTEAAVNFASMPLVPAVVGGGLGLSIGIIGAASYAYRNRGMR